MVFEHNSKGLHRKLVPFGYVIMAIDTQLFCFMNILRKHNQPALYYHQRGCPHLQNLWWNRSQNVGLSPPSSKKKLGPIPTSIFQWDLFHLEAVGPIPWDLVDFTSLGYHCLPFPIWWTSIQRELRY